MRRAADGDPSPLVVAGLLLGPASALGLARFAYALVLPAMRHDLDWSFAVAGSLNTANAAGYLIGALLVPLAVRHGGERRWFVISMAVTSLTLFASAATGNLAVQLALRLIAGVTGAGCFVIGAGLTAQAGKAVSRRRSTMMLAAYFSGVGVGIVLSGLVVPATTGAGGWRVAWLVMGGLSVLCLAGSLPAVRAVPETDRSGVPAGGGRIAMGPIGVLTLCYGLFGAGYIAYMTFIIAALKDAGAGPSEVTVFWVVLGLASALGTLVWSRAIAAIPAGVALAVILAALFVGAALPVLTIGPATAIVSAVVFGGAFLSVVNGVTGAAQRALPAHQWTTAIAILTSSFALGQCIGPVLSGVLSDRPGGVRLGLAAGAVILALAAVVAPFHGHLRRPSPPAEWPT